MAKLFQPIQFWIARLTCRNKISCSSTRSRPSPGLQPATRTVAGFRFAVLRAALHQHVTSPPPRRSGLRFPTPVGHGRGLASRPGCAVPGEGVGSPCLRLRLRPASPTPGEPWDDVSAIPPAASRCSHSLTTLSVCLGSAAPTQKGPQLPKRFCPILRRQPLAVVLRFARTRALLWSLSALTLATGQVFTADHAYFLPAIATARRAATA